MKKLQRLTRMSLALSVTTFIGIIFSALALLDIAQAKEPDLTLEWNIVRVSFLFVIMYIAISLVTIIKLRKAIKLKK